MKRLQDFSEIGVFTFLVFTSIWGEKKEVGDLEWKTGHCVRDKIRFSPLRFQKINRFNPSNKDRQIWLQQVSELLEIWLLQLASNH